MSNTKIVIDKEDFEQKIIGWIERRNYVTKSDILSLFQDLTTEIQIDQSIEERIKHYPISVQIHAMQAMYEQQIIEQLKVKEKCNHVPISIKGKWSNCSKCGMLMQLRK